jgi:hypothetical protein
MERGGARLTFQMGRRTLAADAIIVRRQKGECLLSRVC